MRNINQKYILQMINSVFINAYWMLQSVYLLESVAKNNIYWKRKLK